ncbi:PIN domain-containing protein [Candidatus Micrarchaeota archaeon]|nr:PIN domain-containing protein [Candidatus Micrarchaeota archaeon]MBI5177170.1 PIN domain-containing protein [Candidatus Micrarchaeota archaeon]
MLAYAYENTSPKHAAAANALEKAIEEGTGVLSVQNLAEFCSFATEKLQLRIPHDQVRTIVLELSESMEVATYDSRTVASALSLSSIHKIHFFDALLAATMEKEGISEIMTENERDFRKIPWLTVTNPFKK